MGFRTYDPSLNQFLSRDMYNGALADMNLTTDPFTGNRYTFAAGNPITNIEQDGHMFPGGGQCGILASNPCNPSPGTSSTSPSGSSCPVVELTCGPSLFSPTSQTSSPPSAPPKSAPPAAPHTCVQACIWATPPNNALVGSGAALSWFQAFGTGLHRIGRPAYLARNPWTTGAIDFAHSGTAKALGYGGVAVGTGLNYLQFRGQGDSVGKSIVKTAGATAVGVGAGAVATTTGEIVGGVIGGLVPGLGETGLSEAAGAFIGGVVGGYIGNVLGSNVMNSLFGW